MYEIIVGISLYEFYSMIEKKGIKVFKITGLILGMIFPAIYFLSINIPALKYERLMYFFLFICFLIVVFRKLIQNNPKETVKEIAFTLFGIIYIVFLFAYILRMVSLPQGHLWVLTTFGLVWLSDSTAYFVGISIGKHKLAPNISPKKSIEGAVGGLIGPIVLLVIAKLTYLNAIFMPWWFVFVLGILAGVLGQMGDLMESAIKRDLDIKDSGTLLKGHGGMLDRFDSILFVAPLVFYFVRLFLM
jgi:phosphatidate cytidylyltransferase